MTVVRAQIDSGKLFFADEIETRAAEDGQAPLHPADAGEALDAFDRMVERQHRHDRLVVGFRDIEQPADLGEGRETQIILGVRPAIRSGRARNSRLTSAGETSKSASSSSPGARLHVDGAVAVQGE